MVSQGDWVVECFVAHWTIHYSMNCLVVVHQFTSTIHTCFAHPTPVFPSFMRFAQGMTFSCE